MSHRIEVTRVECVNIYKTKAHLLLHDRIESRHKGKGMPKHRTTDQGAEVPAARRAAALAADQIHRGHGPSAEGLHAGHRAREVLCLACSLVG